MSCWVSSKSRIVELKNHIKEMLGLVHANEFEVFELKDKHLKLLYEEEVISKYKT